MEPIIFNQKIANIGINGIIRWRFFWLSLIAIIVVISGLGLGQFRLDSSKESFLPESDAISLANERFKEQFGNEEFVFILVKTDNLFNHTTLARIRALQKDLEERLPFVDEVNTISNVEFMETVGDTLEIEKIIGEEIPKDNSQLLEVRRKLSSSTLYLDRIVTRDWNHVGVAVTLGSIPKSVWVAAHKGFTPMDQVDWPEDAVIMSNGIFSELATEGVDSQLVEVPDPRNLITPALRVIIKNHQAENFKLMATGIPVRDFAIDQMTAEEGSKIAVIALIAAFLFMLMLFRNIMGVLAPLTVMIATVMILLRLMGWSGTPVSMESMFVAPLLIVLSVSYSVHFINHFNFYFRRKGERLRALHYAYGQSTWPCFLTALTTAIGFASFLMITMKPIRDVGIACAIGALISFILVMIIVPIFYSFGKAVVSDQPLNTADVKKLPRGMVGVAEVGLRFRIPIIAISIGLVIFSSVLSLKIPVETDMLKKLGPNNSFVKESNAITDIMGGYYSYEVMIELQKTDDAKKPDLLNALAMLSEEAKKWGAVKSTMSLVDLVKEINYVMNDRNPEYFAIPDTREKIAQFLLLYKMSGGGELNNWVDDGYSKLRLSVQMSDSVNLDQHISQMQKVARNLFPDEAKISFVGDIPIMLRLMNLLTISQLKSIAIAFSVICLVMMVILRSIRAGFISMVPNIFPLFVIAGFMGLLQINLDLITLMIAPMVIGIVVDNTVHFFIHFKDELSGFRDYKRANQQTFIKIGHALFFTSAVLTLGFAILGFSSVHGMITMGFLATVGIVSALIAVFCISPLLLLSIKPFRKP